MRKPQLTTRARNRHGTMRARASNRWMMQLTHTISSSERIAKVAGVAKADGCQTSKTVSLPFFQHGGALMHAVRVGEQERLLLGVQWGHPITCICFSPPCQDSVPL